MPRRSQIASCFVALEVAMAGSFFLAGVQSLTFIGDVSDGCVSRGCEALNLGDSYGKEIFNHLSLYL